MSVVDVVLGLLMLLGLVEGWRAGTVGATLTFVGFWAGLTLAALLAAAVAPSIGSPTGRAALTLAVLLGLAVLLATLGRALGGWARGLLLRAHLGLVDSVVGAVVAVLGVLLSAWLVGSLLAQSRFSAVSSAVQGSSVMRAVDNALPPVPAFFSQVQSFLQQEGFPAAFAQLSPNLAGPVPTPSDAEAQAIGSPVAGSTAKVLGAACGQEQEGSSFVVAPGLVVTNAHVVAGERDTEVVVGGASYRAQTVLFDPEEDLAFLRTAAPLGPPLHLAASTVPRGTQAAVVGYPEMGALAVVPAGIAGTIDASSRDIYNENVVQRTVYQLNAVVQPGDSGSPVVVAGGTVVGVVFSRSTAQQGVGYALVSPDVASRLVDAERQTAPVGTGACVGG